MRTRSNVRTLTAEEHTDWPQALVSYRTAVGRMLALDPLDTVPPTRPTNKQCWQYLAAVHGRARDTQGREDHSDPLWTTCQHGSWFFFPWHRMFLATLESFVQHFSGDQEWAVPYWYAIDPDVPDPDVLPNAFIAPTVDNAANALYVSQRSTRANTGQPIAEGAIIEATAMQYVKNLKIGNFSTAQLHGLSVGGGEYADPQFMHDINGAIESIPHGPVHNLVGSDYDPATHQPVPPYGYMTDLLSAARDPIFWLHHSNIDRLWQMWLDADPSHVNSADSAWLETSFDFPTPDGQHRSWAVRDVLDTAALGYSYDTVQPPHALHTPGMHVPAVPQVRPKPKVSAPAPPPPPPPQVVGATVDVAMVAGQRTDIELSSPGGSSRTLGAVGEVARPRQWLLRLEGITGTLAAPIYSVYLNLPSGTTPDEHPERLAGTISTFGVGNASRPHGDHDGRGLTFVLDITEAHDALLADDAWDPQNLTIAFVPLVPPAPDDPGFAARVAAAPAVAPDLHAARVAVLVQ